MYSQRFPSKVVNLTNAQNCIKLLWIKHIHTMCSREQNLWVIEVNVIKMYYHTLSSSSPALLNKHFHGAMPWRMWRTPDPSCVSLVTVFPKYALESTWDSVCYSVALFKSFPPTQSFLSFSSNIFKHFILFSLNWSMEMNSVTKTLILDYFTSGVY